MPQFIIIQPHSGYYEASNGVLYPNKENKGGEAGMIVNGSIQVKKYRKGGGVFNGKFLAVKAKQSIPNEPQSYIYLPVNTVRPYRANYSIAEGGSGVKPAVEPVKKEGVSAKSIMDSAKGVVTDKTVLTVAGVGLGTGLVLSWLVGARGSQMAGITATTTLLGGVVGYGFSGESYFGADGKGKPKTLKQNVCGEKDGLACEVKFEDGTVAVKGTWGVNARGKCACIGGSSAQ